MRGITKKGPDAEEERCDCMVHCRALAPDGRGTRGSIPNRDPATGHLPLSFRSPFREAQRQPERIRISSNGLGTDRALVCRSSVNYRSADREGMRHCSIRHLSTSCAFEQLFEALADNRHEFGNAGEIPIGIRHPHARRSSKNVALRCQCRRLPYAIARLAGICMYAASHECAALANCHGYSTPFFRNLMDTPSTVRRGRGRPVSDTKNRLWR